MTGSNVLAEAPEAKVMTAGTIPAGEGAADANQALSRLQSLVDAFARRK
ncbi:MAG: hypothetical protein QG555_1509 [Thermodesulfobacteriota bacterium]|nr:hypothetical protein [Thermodesulfobacteriota bacterium]